MDLSFTPSTFLDVSGMEMLSDNSRSTTTTTSGSGSGSSNRSVLSTEEVLSPAMFTPMKTQKKTYAERALESKTPAPVPYVPQPLPQMSDRRQYVAAHSRGGNEVVEVTRNGAERVLLVEQPRFFRPAPPPVPLDQVASVPGGRTDRPRILPYGLFEATMAQQQEEFEKQQKIAAGVPSVEPYPRPLTFPLNEEDEGPLASSSSSSSSFAMEGDMEFDAEEEELTEALRSMRTGHDRRLRADRGAGGRRQSFLPPPPPAAPPKPPSAMDVIQALAGRTPVEPDENWRDVPVPLGMQRVLAEGDPSAHPTVTDDAVTAMLPAGLKRIEGLPEPLRMYGLFRMVERTLEAYLAQYHKSKPGVSDPPVYAASDFRGFEHLRGAVLHHRFEPWMYTTDHEMYVAATYAAHPAGGNDPDLLGDVPASLRLDALLYTTLLAKHVVMRAHTSQSAGFTAILLHANETLKSVCEGTSLRSRRNLPAGELMVWDEVLVPMLLHWVPETIEWYREKGGRERLNPYLLVMADALERLDASATPQAVVLVPVEVATSTSEPMEEVKEAAAAGAPPGPVDIADFQWDPEVLDAALLELGVQPVARPAPVPVPAPVPRSAAEIAAVAAAAVGVNTTDVNSQGKEEELEEVEIPTFRPQDQEEEEEEAKEESLAIATVETAEEEEAYLKALHFVESTVRSRTARGLINAARARVLALGGSGGLWASADLVDRLPHAFEQQKRYLYGTDRADLMFTVRVVPLLAILRDELFLEAGGKWNLVEDTYEGAQRFVRQVDKVANRTCTHPLARIFTPTLNGDPEALWTLCRPAVVRMKGGKEVERMRTSTLVAMYDLHSFAFGFVYSFCLHRNPHFVKAQRAGANAGVAEANAFRTFQQDVDARLYKHLDSLWELMKHWKSRMLAGEQPGYEARVRELWALCYTGLCSLLRSYSRSPDLVRELTYLVETWVHERYSASARHAAGRPSTSEWSKAVLSRPDGPSKKEDIRAAPDYVDLSANPAVNLDPLPLEFQPARAHAGTVETPAAEVAPSSPEPSPMSPAAAPMPSPAKEEQPAPSPVVVEHAAAPTPPAEPEISVVELVQRSIFRLAAARNS
jgi:hypothetical protein